MPNRNFVGGSRKNLVPFGVSKSDSCQIITNNTGIRRLREKRAHSHFIVDINIYIKPPPFPHPPPQPKKTQQGPRIKTTTKKKKTYSSPATAPAVSPEACRWRGGAAISMSRGVTLGPPRSRRAPGPGFQLSPGLSLPASALD